MKICNYLPKTIHDWLFLRKLDVSFLIRRYERWQLLLSARKNIRKRPLRVLFLVNEVSKWKTQSLYDILNGDPNYEPFIVLTRADIDVELADEVVSEKLIAAQTFFEKCNMHVEMAYDCERKAYIDPMVFNPDIIFYQQPWFVDELQHPKRISHKVLTCYVPYYVPNYGNIGIDLQDGFHVYLWHYYVLNKSWCKVYSCAKNFMRCLPHFLPTGHTMLDAFSDALPSSLNLQNFANNDQYVIYAPHWSFSHPNHDNFENFSTFLKSGRVILEYATSHKEINWVFKPHPSLRHALISSGAMTENEVVEYYSAWEKIGLVCYSGDYMHLFQKSRALITDSASFLVEYACTGMPIIHLVSSDRKIEPMKPSADLFATYYQAHNESEMLLFFQSVIERGQDPRRIERLSAIAKAGIIGVNAAQNILKELNDAFLV